MRRETGGVKGLAVIVVNYRTPDLTIRCLDALEPARAAFPDLKVVVVDGGSGDSSAARLEQAVRERGWASFLPLEVNGGFAFANNRALAALAAAGPLPEAIALVNPDARVCAGALEALAALLDREPRAGAVGALLVQEDGRPQSSAFHFPTLRGELCRGARIHLLERVLGVPSSSIDGDAAMEVPWVTGAAVLLRTAALEEVGLFDDGFFLYFEETDLMRRLGRAGWSVWHEPRARVVHDGGASTAIRDPASGMPHARRMPRYWYESRRRYFALAHGRTYAVLAGLAWLTGLGLWKLRRAVAPREDTGPSHSGRDTIAHGLWPAALDRHPHAPTLHDAAGERPAWMEAVR